MLILIYYYVKCAWSNKSTMQELTPVRVSFLIDSAFYPKTNVEKSFYNLVCLIV
jgi:hypothetical protein